MIKLYGISNCDTVKKARTYLAQHEVEFEFHDFKKLGLDATTAKNWLAQQDWSVLINRKGLTWRNIEESIKQSVIDDSSAIALMLDKTSAIKRPLLERDGLLLHVGFDAEAYDQIFNLKVKHD